MMITAASGASTTSITTCRSGGHMTGVGCRERKAFRVLGGLLFGIVLVMLAGGDLNLEAVESDVGDVPAP